MTIDYDTFPTDLHDLLRFELARTTVQDDEDFMEVLGRRAYMPAYRKHLVRGGLATPGPPPPVALVLLVSPARRREFHVFATFCGALIMQHPALSDADIIAVHINKATRDHHIKDPEAQPVSERWHRAWVITDHPGPYNSDSTRQVYGHLHHAEVAS